MPFSCKSTVWLVKYEDMSVRIENERYILFSDEQSCKKYIEMCNSIKDKRISIIAYQEFSIHSWNETEILNTSRIYDLEE